MQTISNQYGNVKNLKKVLDESKDQLLQEDRNKQFLKGFYNDNEEKVNEIVSKVEKIKIDYLYATNYLGINLKKTDINTFINLCMKFVNDLE